MDKLIFLDIDGVLNCYDRRDFVPECIAAFNRILEATKADVVVSSSWRDLILSGHFSLFGFSRLLRSHGVYGLNIIGHTRASSDVLDEPRSAEIADWLKENRSPTGQRRICILDDDPNAFGGRPGVNTCRDAGLTEANADEAIALLNSIETTA